MSSPPSDPDPGSELPSLADMLPRHRPGRSRPGHTSLSREQVVGAAIELADAEGPEAISMRRIAARLGVGTMTLYRHVADRDALVAYMINEVAAESEPPGRPSGSWRADLELFARQSRDACRRHPWLPAELGTSPYQIAPRLVGWAEFILAALEPTGINLLTAGAILRMLNNYVVGTTLREATESRIPRPDDAAYRAAVASYLRQLASSRRYPLMSELAQITEKADGLDADQSFNVGLQCLLDGVDVLVRKAAGG